MPGDAKRIEQWALHSHEHFPSGDALQADHSDRITETTVTASAEKGCPRSLRAATSRLRPANVPFDVFPAFVIPYRPSNASAYKEGGVSAGSALSSLRSGDTLFGLRGNGMLRDPVALVRLRRHQGSLVLGGAPCTETPKPPPKATESQTTGTQATEGTSLRKVRTGRRG